MKFRYLVVLGILGFGSMGVDGCTNTRSMAEIEADAKRFGSTMGPDQVLGTSCVDYDSDRDGYVSCTVFRQAKDPLAIECLIIAGRSGCKLSIAKSRVQVNQY